jgi:hypothetical protein
MQNEGAMRRVKSEIAYRRRHRRTFSFYGTETTYLRVFIKERASKVKEGWNVSTA